MFTLRRATAEDAQAIGAVFDASVREGWTFLGEVVERPMFTPKQWDDLVAHLAPPHALIVAVDDRDVIVGYSGVHADTGELFLLFVHPEHSGKGVGRALLDAAHEVIREVGHTEVFLYTEERNERARSFYAAAGYQPDGTARDSEANGVPTHELRMVKQFGG